MGTKKVVTPADARGFFIFWVMYTAILTHIAPEMTFDSFLSGNDECRAFADGSKMKPSYVCYAYVFFIVITTLSVLPMLREYPTFAAAQIVSGAATMYIMFQNCVKCNGWRGFWLTAAIGMIVSILVQSLPIAHPIDTMLKRKDEHGDEDQHHGKAAPGGPRSKHDLIAPAPPYE